VGIANWMNSFFTGGFILLDNKMLEMIQCQAAFFFTSDFQMRPLVLAGKISEKLSSVFSVDPSTVPYPPNIALPLEIPRVVLQGDPNGQITVSSLRADVIFNLQTNSDIKPLLSKHISDFSDCFESTQIIRLGLVFQFKLIGEDVLTTVRNEYILPGKIDGAAELYFGWMNKLQVNGIPSNRLVNYICNSLPSPNENGTLTVDTNTIPEAMLDLKTEEIKKYVDECLRQYGSDMDAFIKCS
jgi:hypothetical protein